MFDNSPKFNTVCGQGITIVTNCKLIFTNKLINLRSTETLCDEVLVDLPFRLVRCERLPLFDVRLLPIVQMCGSLYHAIAYSFENTVCRFVCSGDYSAASFAAPMLALFYNGEISAGQIITVRSPMEERSTTVTDDGVILF